MLSAEKNIDTPTLDYLYSDKSGYTLAQTNDSSVENVITKYETADAVKTFEYVDSNGNIQTIEYTVKDVTSKNYALNLKKTEYGSGDSVKYYEWTKDAGENYSLSETLTPSSADNSLTVYYDDTADYVDGSSTSSGSAGAITTSSGSYMSEVNANFIENSHTYSSGNAYGGAIYNRAGTIDSIVGNFINNYVQGSVWAYGGAIVNYNGGKINSIQGDFIGNYAYAETRGASGGAISDFYTSAASSIGTITGNFIGNYAKSDASSYGAFGGAISSYYASTTIGTIIGDFIGNYVLASNVHANGGAVYNAGTTTSITGDFIGNYANAARNAQGGAVYNAGTITSLTGDFISNYTTTSANSDSYSSSGGAIYNTNKIGTISGDFYGNHADSETKAQGGAIYNTGTITSLTGDFINNYTSSKTAASYGGAIYNNASSNDSGDSDALTIVNSSFYNNHADSESGEALGGAIYTTSNVTVTSKDGYTTVFDGNYTNSAGKEDDNAVYVADDSATVTFNLETSGSLVLNDSIDGEEGYSLNFSGDSSGTAYVDNNINNADITNENVTTYILSGEYLDNNNSLAISSGNFNIVSLGLDPIHFRNFDLTGGSLNIGTVDVDLANKEMGRITSDTYTNIGSGTINVNSMNLLSDAADPSGVTAVYFAESAVKDNVATTSLTAYTPIYKYSVNYDSKNEYNGQGSGGYYLFSSDSFNPAVLSASVANQAAQATIGETFKYAFEHADSFSILPRNERIAKINSNYYAISTDYNENLGIIAPAYKNEGLWIKPYTSLEKINLKHGPGVDATTYGTMIGFDSDFIKLKKGWNSVITGYVGYNGSQLRYSGVDTTLNGGILGAANTFYKGNFWTALTATVGAGVGQNYNMYGKEDFTTLMTGVASKTGYNFEFNDGRYIIQPVWNMNYSFINTFDYTNSAGLKIDSKPMHTIQLNPNIRFVINSESGWQPYSSVGMVWNLMNESKVYANNTALPEMSIKPYVEYGLGIQKLFKDNYSAYAQAMVRNGGRKGIAFTFGFRWNIGRDKDSEFVYKPNVSVMKAQM